MLLRSYGDIHISTHALREEGDGSAGKPRRRPRNFYPRPPRGGRPYCFCIFSPDSDFYPRPPRGGRLHSVVCPCFLITISTHALREEGDSLISFRLTSAILFLPTPSARRATLPRFRLETIRYISTHALREEGDQGTPEDTRQAAIFLPTPSARRATYPFVSASWKE